MAYSILSLPGEQGKGPTTITQTGWYNESGLKNNENVVSDYRLNRDLDNFIPMRIPIIS